MITRVYKPKTNFIFEIVCTGKLVVWNQLVESFKNALDTFLELDNLLRKNQGITIFRHLLESYLNRFFNSFCFSAPHL